jgi:hypothetical protein
VTRYARAMLAWILTAGLATLDHCDKRDRVALDTRLAADLRTTYDVTGTGLQVCVDKAVYPYAAGRGHKLLACYQVALGADHARFCGEGDSFVVWHGYRITVMLRTPRFTDSCDVWLRVENA